MSSDRECAFGKEHGGPFYSVAVVAQAVGEGSRLPGTPRSVKRRTLWTVCEECVSHAEFRVLRGSAVLKAISPLAGL